MHKLKADHLHDQVMAAYTDPSPEATQVFSALDAQAMRQMTDEQW
jgi:hypothetical protein